MIEVNGEVEVMIPTTVLLIRAIQAVLVSVTHKQDGYTAVVGAQEEVWRACGDS